MGYQFNPFTGSFDLAGATTIPDPLVVDELTVNTKLTADHIHGNIAGNLYVHVKNTSGTTIAKGTPVYVVGAVGDTTVLEVAAADAANADKIPAIGLLEEDLDNNGFGDAVMFGEITGFNTASYQDNDELYLAAGGGLTATKPASGYTQSLAVVGRVHASTGTVLVWVASGILPTDITYDAATREVRSSTGADATLPLVSSAAAGLIPSPPEGGPTGKVFTDALEWETPASGGSLQSSVKTHTTAELTAGEVEDFVITGGDSFHLLAVTASTPAWVRVYGTAAARTADVRVEPGGTPPGPGNDFYAELATTGTPQTIRFSPVPLVQGTSGDAYVRVVNMDVASRAISLSFTVLTLEA